MEFKIGILKNLNVISDDNGSQWILFSDIKEFMNSKKHRNENKLKSSNVFKWLKGKDKVVKAICDKPAFSVRSVLQFFLAQSEHYNVCNQISKEIQSHLMTKKSDTKTQLTSVQDIYIAVSKAEFLDRELLLHVKINEDDIETIHHAYKNEFSEYEWKKICYFEKHFSKSHNLNLTLETYEGMVLKKVLFFENLFKANTVAKILVDDSKKEIIHRVKRKELAGEEDSVCLTGKHVHRPSVLEMQIVDAIPDQSIVNYVFCVDCTKRCKHMPSVHVYIEIQDGKEDCIHDLVTTVRSFVEREHDEICAEVVFFPCNTINNFIDSDGEYLRFQMRDNVIAGKLLGQTLFTFTHNFEDELPFEETGKCPQCFFKTILKPLSMKSFDLLEEWYLETPLTCQLLFEKFINKYTMQKAESKQTFLTKKYTRLYSQYDALLNVANKAYCGIIQDLNTQELSMNYQSVSTVFQLTSTSGLTQSLPTAEYKLKKKAVSENTYYNTYLRKFPITYNSAAGLKSDSVSLRDCVLILMMDNLVRIKKHADPNPGESRSMQLCTLPITIKGLPQDCIEVEMWHANDCDSSDSYCTCKKDRNLSTEDVRNLVLTQSEDQQSVMDRFMKLMCYGHRDIWRQIIQDELHLLGPKTELNNLDVSLASLQLDDSQPPHHTSEMNLGEFDDVLTSAALEPLALDEISEVANMSLDSITLPPNQEANEAEDSTFEDSFILQILGDSEDDDIHEMSANSSDPQEADTADFMESMLKYFNFNQSTPPSLISRHPPPAIGRDDDVKKLKEVLDDVLVKTDSCQDNAHKILFAPDHKIASNLLKLRENNNKYQIFLPEFPCLHLRKSKITILCSAYKDAGILHILKYMRDEDFQEWRKLISADHIEMATKYIRRISIAFHIAFYIRYIQSLPEPKQQAVEKCLMESEQPDEFWAEFETFMNEGRNKNGTFALHQDIMNHCDEVSAIALAERLGGETGYNLLLAAVKRSLPFSFLNGASSYAAFTTKLLHEHYKCGKYYQNMKHALFSTPIDGSDVNFALDTQREIDHKDVIKAFRSGSTMTSIIPRMSLIDSLNEVHEATKQRKQQEKVAKTSMQLLGLKVTPTDIKYVKRVVGLILRQNGISFDNDLNVYNVYDVRRPVLSTSVPDMNTEEVGQYLIRKFISHSCLFGCTRADEPDISGVHGPKDILQKLKQAKGVTMKRLSVKPVDVNKTHREKEEDKRQKLVKRQTKTIDCFSSQMNACQAVVKPDCSKPKVMKSAGVKQALTKILFNCIQTTDNPSKDNVDRILEDRDLIYSSKKTIPKVLSNTATTVTLEFAGVKFKTQSSSGSQYLKYVENGIIMKTKLQLPKMKRMAVCEEKYKFTPDDFKSATRSQRLQKSNFSVTHLKTTDEILTMEKFDKKTIVTTSEGKSLISTYLARHIDKLNIPAHLTVDVDSECYMTDCHCSEIECVCQKYTSPVRVSFAPGSQPQLEILHHVKQSKGEAEMAQIDWLMEYLPSLQDGESCASIVTSGDIDSVVIHMFSLAYMWPRQPGIKTVFKHKVYVILQKQGNTYDIYNITGILSLIEKHWQDRYIGVKLALVLSLGGNDYLPKFHGISHSKTVEAYLGSPMLKSNLFAVELVDCAEDGTDQIRIHFNVQMYKEFIKLLYCSKKVNPDNFTFDEIRQMSILPLRSQSVLDYRSPQSWMPPSSAIDQLGKNVQCLIAYYKTAGTHFSVMPNFLKDGCLLKLDGGVVEYDLGPDAHIQDVKEVIVLDQGTLMDKMGQRQKRKQEHTPQKGQRRKLKPKATSTPRKS